MKVLVVKKPSEFEKKYMDMDSRTESFVKRFPKKYAASKKSHELQNETNREIVRCLDDVGFNYEVIMRKDLKKIEDYDFVIAAGGDGTVLTTAHHMESVPILGVNTDTLNSVGFYCSADKNNFNTIIKNIETMIKTKVNRLEMALNGEEITPGLNDAYVSLERKHGVCNFQLGTTMSSSEYACSGLLFSTYVGRNARMRNEINGFFKENENMIQYAPLGFFDEFAKNSYFNGTGFSKTLRITALRDNNLISVDGCHRRYEFNQGDVLEVKLGKPLSFFGNLNSKLRKR